jgi:hypothetical protein
VNPQYWQNKTVRLKQVREWSVYFGAFDRRRRYPSKLLDTILVGSMRLCLSGGGSRILPCHVTSRPDRHRQIRDEDGHAPCPERVGQWNLKF